jgi:uncharacterized metal-binding protein YceD (DUF177 family)
MQFNVAGLLKDATGSVRRFELQEDLSNLDPDLEMLGPLVGSVQLLRIHSGILVTASLSTAVRVTCNRCLEPIAMPVRFTIEESFRPLVEVNTGRYIAPDEFEGSTDELEDEALLIDERHILDISEVVRQNIWLAMPMYPGCNWTGAGECPNLTAYLQGIRSSKAGEEIAARGQDVAAENAPEADAEDAVDPRWAALLNLKDRLESSGQA